MSKNAIVIGAGISGLVSGNYLQRSGIQTLILEQAAGPGGVSTSWERKGYHIEGGIHWLIGAIESIPLNTIWRDTGALQENNPVYFKNPIYTLVDSQGQMPLYRDLHGLELTGWRDRLALRILKFHLGALTASISPSPTSRASRPDIPVRFPCGNTSVWAVQP